MASQMRLPSVSTPGGGWTDPDNVFANNGVCATVISSNQNQDYEFGGAVFSIPSGVTINGIEVKVKHGENNNTDYLQITVLDADFIWRMYKFTGNINAGNCAGVALATLGAPSDLWGGLWTPAHINGATFWVRMRSKASGKSGGGWWVDYIEVTVYYTENGGAGWTGVVLGVTNPAKVMGVEVVNIAKVIGVA